jgi:hypothetical protein
MQLKNVASISPERYRYLSFARQGLYTSNGPGADGKFNFPTSQFRINVDLPLVYAYYFIKYVYSPQQHIKPSGSGLMMLLSIAAIFFRPRLFQSGCILLQLCIHIAVPFLIRRWFF